MDVFLCLFGSMVYKLVKARKIGQIPINHRGQLVSITSEAATWKRRLDLVLKEQGSTQARR